MRILQLVQKPQRRGAEVFAFQLSGELRRQGHDVQIVYLYPHAAAGTLPVDKPDRVLGGKERHVFEVAPGVHPSLLRSLLQAIDEYQPDVLQVNGARTVKYGAFAALLRRSRSWVLVYRNIGNPQDWVRTPLHRLYYRRLIMPQIDGIVGVSQTTLDNVRAFYRLSTPMTQIMGAVDPAGMTPAKTREEIRGKIGAPPAAPVIAYVGSLSAEKRLDRLLRLAENLAPTFPDLRVWLIGDGPQRPRLEEQARNLGIAQTAQFLGVQANVADFLQAADLLVLTSDTEGIPGVLLEAGYMGLPVVATDVGGVSECVIDGETGLLVAREDEAGLAAAVEGLLHNSALREQMSHNAGRHIRQHFMLDAATARYAEFYRTILAQRRNSLSRSLFPTMTEPYPNSQAGATAQPLVSIVIPCHNYGRFLADAIESCLRQTYPHIEVIVVDDGSTDETASVCQAYLPRIAYLHQPCGGVSQVRNRGARICRGEYVIFLDADDLLEPDYVEECLGVATENPDAAFVYTQARHFGDETGVTSFPAYDVEQLKISNFIHASPLMRTGIVRKHPYDESNRENLEDWGFYLTLAAHGYGGVLLDKPLLLHRLHGNNKTNELNALVYRRFRVGVMRRHIRFFGWRMYLTGVWRLNRLRVRLLLRRLRAKGQDAS